jgi:O-antigen/teichoic acid export membrane protein
LTMLNSVFVCVLVASGRERLYTWSMVRGTIVLVIAVVILTPLAGTQGASWALLIGEGTTLALMMRNARKAIPLPSASILVRPLAGCALMIAVFWALGPINLIAACAAGIVAYAIPIVAGSAMTKEEFHFLRERFI